MVTMKFLTIDLILYSVLFVGVVLIITIDLYVFFASWGVVILYLCLTIYACPKVAKY